MKLKVFCKNILMLTIPCLVSFQAFALDDFQAAKRIMPSIMKQLEKPSTLYCGCPLIFSKNRYTPDLKACGYQVRKNAKRAARIEAEHIMPAWEFGHQLKCWQEAGRKKCEADDQKFRMIEGDLHNLYPAVGEVNGDRSNFRYSEWNAQGMYGQCEMAIDFKARRAQPPKRARGLISRSYLYMAHKWDIKLSPAQRKLYESWNKIYPPTKDECKWNNLVKKTQGDDNTFISKACNTLTY